MQSLYPTCDKGAQASPLTNNHRVSASSSSGLQRNDPPPEWWIFRNSRATGTFL
jgi:hypothetical protein